MFNLLAISPRVALFEAISEGNKSLDEQYEIGTHFSLAVVGTVKNSTLILFDQQ